MTPWRRDSFGIELQANVASHWAAGVHYWTGCSSSWSFPRAREDDAENSTASIWGLLSWAVLKCTVPVVPLHRSSSYLNWLIRYDIKPSFSYIYSWLLWKLSPRQYLLLLSLWKWHHSKCMMIAFCISTLLATVRTAKSIEWNTEKRARSTPSKSTQTSSRTECLHFALLGSSLSCDAWNTPKSSKYSIYLRLPTSKTTMSSMWFLNICLSICASSAARISSLMINKSWKSCTSSSLSSNTYHQ